MWFKEGFRVELWGSCWELCKNSFPCENPALLESGGEKKIPQKSFWKLPRSLGDFSICILPFMHTWILSRTRDGCPSKKEFD